MESRRADAFELSQPFRRASTTILTRFQHTGVALGRYRLGHWVCMTDHSAASLPPNINHIPTFTDKLLRRSCQHQLVPECIGSGTSGDAWLHELGLDPIREPSHVAVAMQWVVAECPERNSALALTLDPLPPLTYT